MYRYMYRVTKTDESGGYTQKDYRSQYAASQQIEKWAREVISVAADNKVTMTIELVP